MVARWTNAHSLHELFQSGLLSLLPTTFVRFDGAEQLSALTSPVLHKALDILLQTVDRVTHFFVELLSPAQPRLQIAVSLIYLAVLVQDGITLAREGLVLVLLALDTLVLQQIVIRPCQLLHKRRLLVVRLQYSVLVRTELLQLCLEQLSFLVRDRLLVEDEDIRDVVVVDL